MCENWNRKKYNLKKSNELISDKLIYILVKLSGKKSVSAIFNMLLTCYKQIHSHNKLTKNYIKSAKNKKNLINKIII